MLDDKVADQIELCYDTADQAVVACRVRTVVPGGAPSTLIDVAGLDGVATTLQWVGLDGAGNRSATMARPVKLDAVGPTLMVDQAGSGFAFVIGSTDAILSGQVQDGGTVARVVMRLAASDGAVTWQAATMSGNQWSYTPQVNTPGRYTLIIEAWDKAGNASAAGPYQLEVTTPTAVPMAVQLAGPTLGMVNSPYSFTAAISPSGSAQPITYLWQADEQTPISQSGGLTNSVTYLWATPGDKRITVTAMNATATVSQALTITIGVEPPKAIYLPIVAR